MNKKRTYLSYFLLAGLIFTLLNLPSTTVSALRSMTLYSLALHADNAIDSAKDNPLSIQTENFLLKKQLKDVRAWLEQEDAIDARIMRLQQYNLLSGNAATYKAYYQRRLNELTSSLENEVWQVAARVILREPSFWSSALWIDIGEDSNKQLKKIVVAKNSPVLSGDNIVGVVEEVQKNRSRVRLITDNSLTPAVRAVRGALQEDTMLESLAIIKELLSFKESSEERESLIKAIETYEEGVSENFKCVQLAKGILQGSSYPIWRMRSNVLRGIGFNFEFDDEEGFAMELHKQHQAPLLQVGDLLVTTGMDGVFPAGLNVAYVTKIFPLKEGSFSYEIEAKSTLPNISTIEHLRVLPPL